MEKPLYRAFVSSTYVDLKEHRARAIDVLRRSGLHVDPMEDWTADDREPKAFSQQRIEGCHLCVLLVAYRRGYVPPGATLSITQMEYQQAVKQGVPVLPFLLGEDEPWRSRFDERAQDAGIGVWREQLKQRHGVGSFGSPPDSLDVGPSVTRWLQQQTGAPPAPAVQIAADRNLLYGILALQMNFITRDDLIRAMHAWVLEKTRPLGDILREHGALAGDVHALLEPLVRKHVELHGHDVRESLVAMRPDAALAADLASFADPQVQATLNTLHIPPVPAVVSGARAPAGDPLTVPAADLIGSAATDDRFEIINWHASGGLGDVFVARDLHFSRNVALKRIQQRYAHVDEARARFLREAGITGRLEHPGIVPVYACGQRADGQLFYAMRFIQGESFQQAIERLHRAAEGVDDLDSWPRLRELLVRFVDACNAVAYAHSGGVLHRDLKPENIMLGPFGETLVVDWGLAKVMGGIEQQVAAESPPSLSSEASPTLAGARLGTPQYMSPEQAAGRLDELGAPSDVYSLGATLYCLLTGRAPFPASTVVGTDAVLAQVQSGTFPSPQQVDSRVPGPLEAICLKAMALRPKERYASPRQLADDVERWLAGASVPVWEEKAQQEAVIKHREKKRLEEIPKDSDAFGWRRWGPYLSDRAWATVREDYSANGDAWGYLPHNLARSKAYRWGEDGIAGISDRYQFLCFAPAFWNGKDPILKERYFGVTPHEGNHGEDVKEYYFHVDNTPTHSYMKLLYKYPQAEYPYGRIIDENKRRNGQGYEFELLDTGLFNEDRYFDIFIEYAKVDPEDIIVRIEAFNRGPEAAPLHVLPHLWFRNIWAWTAEAWTGTVKEPIICPGESGVDFVSLVADDESSPVPEAIPAKARLGKRHLYAPAGGELMFTDNETNGPRVHGAGSPSRKPYVKDAFHRHVVHGEDCLNPARAGTKAALHYRFDIPPSQSATVLLRLSDKGGLTDPLGMAAALVAQRQAEADRLYESIHKPRATEDERRVQRQAFAGLLWSKQSYLFDVSLWLDGDAPSRPPPEPRQQIRNQHWRHLNSMRIMTMPDKWEYPWFSAWDLAFHCVAFAAIDPQFAKEQLWLLLFEQFQHPNGQIPAYEWEFSDLEPPMHAWAVWRVFSMEREREKKDTGNPNARGDRDFLEKCFQKLVVNFIWWVNRVDREGNNLFEGGFLGLDNITVADRSERLPGAAVLEQADAIGWMGLFCLNLMRIALELARENPVYEGTATKFFQHYCSIAHAMKHMGNRRHQPLWDDTDGFFYDVLRFPNGDFRRVRVRSLVGLIPLFAIERLEVDWMLQFKEFTGSFKWFSSIKKSLVRDVVHQVDRDGRTAYVLTLLSADQIHRLLQRVWDESEFLSPHGVRSLSKAHAETRNGGSVGPFRFGNTEIGYEPAEAESKIKGGNSNWRGPVLFPMNFLLIESLRKLAQAYGPDAGIPAPAGNGPTLTYRAMARELADRLIRIFTRDQTGRRPVYGGADKFQNDPHWKDYLLFYEYFHGDNGVGLGASHQTGWTALVASLIDEWRR